jgi:hypothetical protein
MAPEAAATPQQQAKEPMNPQDAQPDTQDPAPSKIHKDSKPSIKTGTNHVQDMTFGSCSSHDQCQQRH